MCCQFQGLVRQHNISLSRRCHKENILSLLSSRRNERPVGLTADFFPKLRLKTWLQKNSITLFFKKKIVSCVADSTKESNPKAKIMNNSPTFFSEVTGVY